MIYNSELVFHVFFKIYCSILFTTSSPPNLNGVILLLTALLSKLYYGLLTSINVSDMIVNGCLIFQCVHLCILNCSLQWKF